MVDHNEFDLLVNTLAKALGADPAALRQEMQAKRVAAQRAAARQNYRFNAALGRQTEAQLARVRELQADGMRVTKLLVKRDGSDVAVFMQGQKWDTRRSRLGWKLAMVYPDGTFTTTFEKTLARREGW